MILLSLILLGITLYFIVQYSVARVTSTPWWILWLVLMAPAFLIAVWTLTHRSTQNMPLALLIGAFALSSITYFMLLSLNPRKEPSLQPPSSQEGADPETASQQISQVVNLLNAEEQGRLQNCFPWSLYYLQNIDYRPQAVICRGQLRSEPDKAYQNIQKNIQAEFGDRFLVIFQMGAMDQPFFALVTNPHGKRSEKTQPITRPGLALGLLVATLVTTTLAGVTLANPNWENVVTQNPAIVLQGLPYALALILILGCHELGHYFAARFYKIKTTLPYFIPVPFFLGTLGAYIQMRIPAPNRKGLFDVGIAGPLAGLVITLPLLLWGLFQSQVVPLPEKPSFLTPDPKFSILFSVICRLVFGNALTPNVGIELHPVALAGLLGLVITALNLMPVGQLDGGHIVHAMYGQRTSVIVGRITQFVVLLLAFVYPVVWSLWALILILMPIMDEPALNDVSELDNKRDVLGLLTLGLLLCIVLPVPNGLEQFLFAANPSP
jgi:membrane-associated protease RseP (regulator of RpoE activity)